MEGVPIRNLDKKKRWTSRRKACDRCMKGRRKCDMKHPCTRCSRQGCKCTYPRSQEGHEIDHIDHQTDSVLEESFVINNDLEHGSSNYSMQASTTELNGADDRNICILHYYDMRPPAALSMSTQRTQLCIDYLTGYVRSMSQLAEVPFSKVKMSSSSCPSPLHMVFLASGAYSQRDTHNEAFLFKSLAIQSCGLLRDLNRNCSLEVQLEYIQSLLLLLIMQLFSNNELATSLGESQIPAIERAMLSLQSDTIYALANGGSNPDRTPYRTWLLSESVHRALLLLGFIRCTFQQRKNGYTDLLHFLARLPLTVQGQFWKAGSEDQWNLVRSFTPYQVLPYTEASRAWFVNQREDRDEFQHMLFDACRAVNHRGD